jgi:23S rRNA (adenine2030-N6)-methyltransferase
VNYDHAFHAGNPADVFKHAALSLVLRELGGRADPLVYVETHAGAGRYLLEDPTGEWTQGIGRLTSKSVRRRLPELAAYLGAVNGGTRGSIDYPGSPAIARAVLREGDRIELFELNPRDKGLLDRWLTNEKDPRVMTHLSDGYRGLARMKLDPSERLVALIDPPYESVDEWAAIHELFTRSAEKRPGAVLMLWYPIKAGPPHEGRPEALRSALEEAGVRGLSLEVRSRGGLLAPRTAMPKVRGELAGTGLLFVGAPTRAIARFSAVIPELSRSLAREEHGRGFEATWIGWG